MGAPIHCHQVLLKIPPSSTPTLLDRDIFSGLHRVPLGLISSVGLHSIGAFSYDRVAELVGNSRMSDTVT